MTFPFASVFAGGLTITWINRPTVTSRDSMGVEQRTGTTTTLTQIPFWQETTTVDVQGQTMVKEESYILVPNGTNVDASDQFVINGGTYRVDGQPFPLVSPFSGTAPGIQIKLEQVTG